MKAIVLVSLCLLLAACGRPEGYFLDNAMMSFRANQECVRMGDSRSNCAGDLIAAEPRDARPLWSD